MLDVIIPVKNSEAVLENCLKTLRNQTVPVNIIIVDAHSTDKTIEIAKKYSCTVVDEPKSNVKGSRRAVACNEGLRHSGSNFVAFLDSDTEPPLEWAEDMEKAMSIFGQNVGAFTSGCEPDTSSGLAVAINNVMKIASNHARKYDTLTEIQSVPGYNAVYRRSAIDEVGGFSEEIGGCEDWELNYRLRNAGYKLFGIPESPVIHKERATYKAFSKQMQGYGWSWGRLLKVKHIFKLSRALPLLALIFVIIAVGLIIFSPINAIFWFLVGLTITVIFLSFPLTRRFILVFLTMQLSLAIGYFRGLFL